MYYISLFLEMCLVIFVASPAYLYVPYVYVVLIYYTFII